VLFLETIIKWRHLKCCLPLHLLWSDSDLAPPVRSLFAVMQTLRQPGSPGGGAEEFAVLGATGNGEALPAQGVFDCAGASNGCQLPSHACSLGCRGLRFASMGPLDLATSLHTHTHSHIRCISLLQITPSLPPTLLAALQSILSPSAGTPTAPAPTTARATSASTCSLPC